MMPQILIKQIGTEDMIVNKKLGGGSRNLSHIHIHTKQLLQAYL